MTIVHELDVGEQEVEAESQGCPFLVSAVGDQVSRYPGGVYCELPAGATRVPSTDELAWFCTNGRHWSCPRFRRWRHRTMTSAP